MGFCKKMSSCFSLRDFTIRNSQLTSVISKITLWAEAISASLFQKVTWFFTQNRFSRRTIGFVTVHLQLQWHTNLFSHLHGRHRGHWLLGFKHQSNYFTAQRKILNQRSRKFVAPMKVFFCHNNNMLLICWTKRVLPISNRKLHQWSQRLTSCNLGATIWAKKKLLDIGESWEAYSISQWRG